MTTTSALPLARDVDRARFSVTRFAAGLGFPGSMAALTDGSILTAVTSGNPFGTSPSQLVRLVDVDRNGVSEARQVLATLPGFVTSVRRVGSLVFALSTGRAENPSISIFRTGSTPADPLLSLARLTLNFPADFRSGDNPHTTYALAARPSPAVANAIELYFNIGSRDDHLSTDPALQVSLFATGSATSVGGLMPPDSIQRVLVRDLGASLEVSAPSTIATGLRNAAGISFDREGNLFFEDNGFSIDPNNPSATTDQDISFSADELNFIAGSELGVVRPDFGFAESYIRYADGVTVNPAAQYRAPLVAFLPINGRKSEGAVEIGMAPTGFPADFASTVFTSFFGKFGVGTASNDENPVVAADSQTRQAFHFINSSILGHPSGVLGSGSSLYLADYSSTGTFYGIANGISADVAGVIYRITPINPASFSEPPSLTAIGATSADLRWMTSQSAISSLEVWGGTIPAWSPRGSTLRTVVAGTGFLTTTRLEGLQADTLYSYRVNLGDLQVGGSFRTGSVTLPSIAVSGSLASVDENAGTLLRFSLTRTGNTNTVSSVDWVVVGTGAAPAAAADFIGGVLPSGRASFAAGQTVLTITISVAGDTFVEADETFTVRLSNPIGATLSVASALGTIRNDDTSTDRTAPVISGLAVEGSQLVLSFSEAVLTPGLSPTRFGATVDGVGRTITGISVGADRRQLRLALSETAPTAAQSVRLTYSDPSPANDESGAVQDDAGNDLATISASGLAADTFVSAVSVTALASTTANLTLTGGAAINGTGNALNNTLTGNSAANQLRGALGDDVIRGNGGTDRLFGGSGNDSLSGGDGGDTFVFNTPPNGSSNRDLITDFVSGSDKLVFSKAIYTGFSSTATTISSSEFRSGSGVITASTTAQRFLYDTSSGLLRYDGDGSGSASAPVAVALLGATIHPLLASTDLALIA